MQLWHCQLGDYYVRLFVHCNIDTFPEYSPSQMLTIYKTSNQRWNFIQFNANNPTQQNKMKTNAISKKRFSLRKAEKVLDRSCDHMELLQIKISNLERRQARAKSQPGAPPS